MFVPQRATLATRYSRSIELSIRSISDHTVIWARMDNKTGLQMNLGRSRKANPASSRMKPLANHSEIHHNGDEKDISGAVNTPFYPANLAAIIRNWIRPCTVEGLQKPLPEFAMRERNFSKQVKRLYSKRKMIALAFLHFIAMKNNVQHSSLAEMYEILCRYKRRLIIVQTIQRNSTGFIHL